MRRKEQGVALVLAVFIITVLAALGAYIVTVGSVQHQTIALTLQQTRALNAARAGAEWVSYQIAATGNCPAAPIADFDPGAPTLSAFTVTDITCNVTTHTISGGDINIYVIDATATAGAYDSPDYVSRHVRTIVSGPA
ncbi:MAG TPA: agglutinin biogenesis protein MshP [Gammaproteobacteria bacterium]|nr:agglutinin biogenesis protein MshP [Gammaproteobacteria bacterium]